MDKNNIQYDILLILILLRLNRSRCPTILPSTDYCPLPEWIMAVQIEKNIIHFGHENDSERIYENVQK